MTKKVQAVPRLMAVSACLLLITWLSLKVVPVRFVDFYGWSKVHHALAYGGLTLVIGWALEAIPSLIRHRWLIAVLAAMAVGCLMEILQYMLASTRHARLSDVLADFIGSMLAVSLAYRRSNRE